MLYNHISSQTRNAEDSATIATTTTTTGEEGVVSLPEAPPTTTAPSVDGQAGSPVAQSPVARSNLTDLEKAMREAGKCWSVEALHSRPLK